MLSRARMTEENLRSLLQWRKCWRLTQTLIRSKTNFWTVTYGSDPFVLHGLLYLSLREFLMAQWVKNWPAKQETHETWVQFLGREDPLEEGMTTHSSILIWKIPWTEEPGGLQSKASQGVRHDWVTKCGYRWLVNKRNLLLTVLYAGRPRSEGQHSQVLGRTLFQSADSCHLVSSHCRAQRKETSSLASF